MVEQVAKCYQNNGVPLYLLKSHEDSPLPRKPLPTLLTPKHVTDPFLVNHISCKKFIQLSATFPAKNNKMSDFLHFICFLVSMVNKIWIHEICKSLHSVFIYILNSVLAFLELGLVCKIQWKP